MTDYSELQRAAEAVKAMDYPWEHTIRDGRLGKTSTQYARLAHPSNVLALIAEKNRLSELLECAHGDCRQAMQIIEKLMPDADRYRWLRDDAVDPGTVIDKKVGVFNSEDGGYPIWEYRSGADLDAAIDAAMSKEVQG